MNLFFSYGNDVLALPAAVISHIDKATKRDLRVLLCLAAEQRLTRDTTVLISAVAKALEIDVSEVENAISFWRGAGVLSLVEDGEIASVTVAQPVANAKLEAPKASAVADRGLPSYSADELAGILERRRDLSALIDACQQALGKIFNTVEVGIVAGMRDYLGFEGEYILLLLSHCARMEKKSLRYAEKMAISLYDDGVTEVAALEERLLRIETMATATGKIRAMFGIASRALTTKEKAMIEKWVCVMQYTDDVLQKAYETTVDAIGKPSIAYANTVLERWYAEGYRTVEDVERALADYRREKSGGSSFDVEDFFQAALKNTYGET